MSRYTERESELIGREAATFIAREAGPGSLITVTRSVAAARGERVTVFVSVFPEEKTQAALAFLARQREAFSEYLKAHTRLSPLPRVMFLPDNGEQNRQRLDEISRTL